MCQSEEDAKQAKLKAVARFVSEDAALNFRGQLLGLARAKQRQMIEEDLARDDELNRHLKDLGFTVPLSETEQRDCSDWGVAEADKVKNDSPSLRDQKIAQRLKDWSNGAGSDSDEIGPLGA